MNMTEHTSNWNALIANLPGARAHALQTWEWGLVKSRYGWQAFHLLWREGSRMERWTGEAGARAVAASLVLERRIPSGGAIPSLRVLYAPRGPLLDWGDSSLRKRVLLDLRDFASSRGAIFLKIDPDVPVGVGEPGADGERACEAGREVRADLKSWGWQFSPEQIQFRNTVQIDLSPSEEELLRNMKQKTRYNVRLAGRRGVRVRVGSERDLGWLYQMYAETALRDGFTIRSEDYYRTVWGEFLYVGTAEPLIAEVDGEAVAALIVFRFDRQAWYMYGMSRDLHRDKMPNYLLQWEAMRRARASGCKVYDLWGAPDVFDEQDPMWGVYRFKQGLGGQVVQHIGAWDLPLRPQLYRFYHSILPRILDVLRRRGEAQTREALSA